MLVLTRKPGEKIRIGADITITVLEVKGNRVRLDIDAPEDIRVVRAELSELAEVAMVGSGEPRDRGAVF